MKKIIVLFIATMFLFGCADSNANDTNDTNGLKWHTNVEKAVEIAKKEDKRVLVQFSGSDWCKWCIKLNDEVFNKKDFADYAKDKMIFSSGRASLDLVFKASKMSVPVIITNSSVTYNAAETAQKAGLTLIGSARGKRFNIYSCPERII